MSLQGRCWIEHLVASSHGLRLLQFYEIVGVVLAAGTEHSWGTRELMIFLHQLEVFALIADVSMSLRSRQVIQLQAHLN